ncbi:MAG: 50S ribosomal protein L25 [Anaerolineae bacterium]|nr:50S ribosomal protein L25 [Anaerolineae bacterium]
MATLELQAEPRTAVGRGLRKLRDEGYVPAVLYGHGLAAQNLQVAQRALERLLAHGGAHSLISLSVAGVQEPYTVLLREIQRYPTRPQVLHVDFYRVVMTEKLQTSVPLVLVGQSPAVASGMAALIQNLDSVEVECLPGDLPSALEIDISVLERTDQNILVSDLTLPPGVEILEDPETVLVSLAAARVAVEEEAVVPEAEEVEVVAKGKAAKGIEEEEEA